MITYLDFTNAPRGATNNTNVLVLLVARQRISEIQKFMGYFFLLTYGCQMNKNDSERIAGLLSSLGLKATDKAESADVIVVNTCSVRQSAEDRVYGQVRNWQVLRKNKPNLVIAITGCMPGRDKDGKMMKKLKGVDLFFPIDELTLLPERLRGLNYSLLCHPEEVALGDRRGDLLELARASLRGLPRRRPDGIVGTPPRNDTFEGVGADYLTLAPLRPNNFQAFITIQTGCNNFCTYCVVPYARGREKNRPVKEILREIKEFVKNRGKEVTLLGQVVNNYQAPDVESFCKKNAFVRWLRTPVRSHNASHAPGRCTTSATRTSFACIAAPVRRLEPAISEQPFDHFAALLWEINQIDGLERVHWTAADPQYFSDAQIQALSLPKQVNYLHLPVQSGDNEILRKMNRKYTREEYIDLIKKIRQVLPEIAIGTDLIVGFPGETEEQFQNTLDLYRQCDFDISYPAMYSERSGTAAYKAARVPLLPRGGSGLPATPASELAWRAGGVAGVSPFADNVPLKEKKRRWSAVQELMEEITLRKNQKYKGKVVEVLVEECSDGLCSGHSSEMKLVQFLGNAELVGQTVKVTITQPNLWVMKGKLFS